MRYCRVAWGKGLRSFAVHSLSVALLILAAGPSYAASPRGVSREPHWLLAGSDALKARIVQRGEGADVHISALAKRPWTLILAAPYGPLEKGKVYRFSFSASATPASRLMAGVGAFRSTGLMHSGQWYFGLEPTMKAYSYTFTMRQESNPDSYFMFHLGYMGPCTLSLGEPRIECLGEAPPDAIPVTFKGPTAPRMRRGIQFGVQFASPFEGTYGSELRTEYLDVIKRDGRFDTIRLPVWWEYHMKSTSPYAPYTIDPEFLRRVDWAVSNSLTRGFYTIVNMHWFRAFEKDPPKHKAEYLSVWKQIADYFKDYPDYLFFELFNEPNGALDAYWNEYLAECYDLVRKTNPTRTIIISSVSWANMERVKDLALPERIRKDPNVLIQFHAYVPGDFCFQGSPGNHFENIHDIRWLGTEVEKKRITASMDEMQEWASRNGVRLINGEFCAQAVPAVVRGSLREDRLRWVRFIRQECERRGIPWNYYDFCEEGSKVYDIVTGEWDEGLMKALFDD